MKHHNHFQYGVIERQSSKRLEYFKDWLLVVVIGSGLAACLFYGLSS